MNTPQTTNLRRVCNDPSLPKYVVSADFAEKLEQENAAMRQAIKSAYETIDGMDEHLEGNCGMFILMAQEKLRPFIES